MFDCCLVGLVVDGFVCAKPSQQFGGAGHGAHRERWWAYAKEHHKDTTFDKSKAGNGYFPILYGGKIFKC